jgi:L-ascorbate metabolism protein UlaG (beta-lactamase superfamily)
MWFLLVALVLVPLVMTTVGISISAPRYKGPVTDHFNGKTFTNPTGVKAKGTREVFKWMFTRKRGKWTENKTDQYGPRPLAFFKEGIRITFVNHTTFLIQVDGINILTDPVYSERVSPFTWAGPKRMRKPGIRFEDLPRIHIVLLSHNHYDHLDIETMRIIQGAHHPRIITPLGVKAYLDKEQIVGAVDLDWWDETTLLEKIKITSVPAQHFSGRGSLDRDATLWCGYVIETVHGKVYFAGDTGYNDVTFKEIGERLNEIEVSIIPIGAYKPRWFMSPIHVEPEEAVKIHVDTKSQVSIASHFGTFPLADDAYEDPVTDLKIALQKHHLSEEDFMTLKEGESKDF